MIGLSDILSAIKNLVQATSALSIQYQTSATVTVPTLIVTGSGTLFNISVVVPGSAAGTVYNTIATNTVLPANALMVIPDTAGVYPAALTYGVGLVVVPGTGQSVNITYTKAS